MGPHTRKCGAHNKQMWAWQALEWATPPHPSVNK